VAAEAEQVGLDEAMREQVPLRTRMFALLGGSSALGDHLVAHPEKWVLLQAEFPTEADMFREMLSSVGAVPEVIELTDEASLEKQEDPEYRKPSAAGRGTD
ncbi:hypothetical protein, partial [Corynebacterium sp. HMSC076C10]|uniref:hypothetical protein n=1 Tax=Corynebacterium sp. HMSC076C10 TaxID=1739361 RepID=UPI000ABBC412